MVVIFWFSKQHLTINYLVHGYTTELLNKVSMEWQPILLLVAMKLSTLYKLAMKFLCHSVRGRAQGYYNPLKGHAWTIIKVRHSKNSINQWASFDDNTGSAEGDLLFHWEYQWIWFSSASPIIVYYNNYYSGCFAFQSKESWSCIAKLPRRSAYWHVLHVHIIIYSPSQWRVLQKFKGREGECWTYICCSCTSNIVLYCRCTSNIIFSQNMLLQ